MKKVTYQSTNPFSVLFGLKDNPNDYVGALGRLARPMRQMYVHAVQSFIWNIIVGDFVQPGENEKLKVVEVTAENIKNHTMDEVVITMPGFDVQYSKVIESELEPILAKVQDHHLN